MPTVLPFHRRVVNDAAYIGADHTFGVYTSWIETEFDNTIAPYDGETTVEDPAERETLTVEVGGKRLAVSLPAGLGSAGAGTPGGAKPQKRTRAKSSRVAASGDALTAPMQGTIVKLTVEDGQTVQAGELVVVLEAMKMEQPIKAHKTGTVTDLTAVVGATVTSGAVLCSIKS